MLRSEILGSLLLVKTYKIWTNTLATITRYIGPGLSIYDRKKKPERPYVPHEKKLRTCSALAKLIAFFAVNVSSNVVPGLGKHMSEALECLGVNSQNLSQDQVKVYLSTHKICSAAW